MDTGIGGYCGYSGLLRVKTPAYTWIISIGGIREKTAGKFGYQKAGGKFNGFSQFVTAQVKKGVPVAEAKQKLLYLDTPPEARAPEAEPEPEPAPEPEPEPELEHPVTILEPTPAMDETMMMPPEKVEELRLQSGIGSDDTMVDMRPVSSDAGDFEAQAAGDTIPPWLMGEDGAILDEVEAVEAAKAGTEEE